MQVEALGERLSALRLCEAGAQARMERSLASIGQLSAVAVFSVEPGRFEVIDGFKRLRAARALGLRSLRAWALEVDVAGAKVALSALHERSGLTELEEAWLVRSLYREDHLDQPEIARRLSRHKSWVCRRLMVAEALDDVLQADVRLGLLSASAAAALARLPRCNQQLAGKLVTRTGMTARQTARLVEELLVCADEPERDALLSQRSLSPPPRGAPHPARRARSEAEWTMADVGTLTRAAARLQARLLGQPLSTFGPRQGELCADALAALCPVLAALTRTIAAATGKAPPHALDHSRRSPAPDGLAPEAGPVAAGDRESARGEPQHCP